MLDFFCVLGKNNTEQDEVEEQTKPDTLMGFQIRL